MRPLLALDVDGVINLFGFEHPGDASSRGDLHMLDGMPCCIAHGTGPRLARLAEAYELVWATGWEDRANDHLPYLLGLPGALPTLSFATEASPTRAHWKLAAIEEHGSGRPLAWVDDCFDEECRSWAAARPEPTLLVATEPDRGLEDGHVEAMLAWARDGYTP